MSLKSQQMPNIARRAIALFVVLLTVAGTGLAATASDFYLSLLRRGIASYDAGRYDAAARELDLAAFGLIESVDHFETAKIYSAIANDKLGRPAQARAAAQRVVAAERVARRFSQISLPGEVRTTFVAVAKKVLPAQESAALTSNAPVPPVNHVQPRVTPQQTPPATTTTAPPVTAPRTTPPATTATTTTQPATKPATQPATKPQPQRVEPAPQPQRPAVVPEAPKPQPKVVEQPRVETPKVVERPRVETPKVTEQPKVVEQKTVPFTPEPVPQPKVETPKPQPQQIPAPKPAPSDAAPRLAAASRLLTANNLLEARAIYRDLIETSLDRANVLAVAEGAYRARDFATVVRAIDRAGTLGKGEEPYRYYLAVALYETGNYRRAKRELAGALPFIEVTPSVERYRAKIEGSLN